MSPPIEAEILGTIKSLKNKQSISFDNFSVELVKNIGKEIAHFIAYIINVNFESGIFPEALKNSVIVLLFKYQNLSTLKT